MSTVYLTANLIVSFFLKKLCQWFPNTLWIRISPPRLICSHTHMQGICEILHDFIHASTQPPSHHCSSCSPMPDLFPILRWALTVHSRDSQTPICIQIICISNKFPSDVDSLFRLQCKYHFLKPPKIIRKSSKFPQHPAHLHINCYIPDK